MMYDPTETDAQLVARLQGALRVVGITLADATPEVLARFRNDDWRLIVSRDGIHVLNRRSDAVSAAGEMLADEAEGFLAGVHDGLSDRENDV